MAIFDAVFLFPDLDKFNTFLYEYPNVRVLYTYHTIDLKFENHSWKYVGRL